MNSVEPKISFGFVNCNRLFYLQSSVESLLECSKDYENKEIIVVDNASVEEGTSEYLDSLEERGFKVFRQTHRDPSNEYARGLNIIASESTGDFICPLEGDTQFVIDSKWLSHCVKFFQEHYDNIGCMQLDAQRRVRNMTSKFAIPPGQENSEFPILFQLDKNPVSGAGSVMYSRKVLDLIYPWVEANDSHEGGGDSETKMLAKINNIMRENGFNWACAVPIASPSVGIHTDPRGTNARIRGNRRYGVYFAPKDDHRYYKIHEFDELIKRKSSYGGAPIPIEDLAISIGWEAPIDETGNWKKNPIRPSTAGPDDYVELKQINQNKTTAMKEFVYVDEWMEE